ncbi:MAG: amino acid permease, partial [Vulcanimicrobiaceae bacterium]
MLLNDRVKSLARLMEEAGNADTGLRRTLGPLTLTAMGIGGIIGTGIFVLTGIAAATKAGPGLTISFAIAGFVAALAALCYAEVASIVPIAGSAYTYAYVTVGELLAWIIGWDLILDYGVGASTVSIGWSGALVDLRRDLPIGIMATMITCAVLYIAVVAVLTAVAPYNTLNGPSPVSHVILSLGINWAGAFISVGVLCGLTTVLLTQIFGQSRIIFAMS